MRADKIPTVTVARARENIETSFEPIVEAMCDLDRFVPRMIRRQRAVFSFLRALRREVVVQLHHRDAARNSFRAVNLDFVVVLSASESRQKTHSHDNE